ncbi:MAG: Uma2 family endonuclease [Caulobacterales bacterium]|jgi:Uma2 family endonuclease
MNAPHRLALSAEDYLVWEARQERKHELVNGVNRLMAGETAAHEMICLNIALAMKQMLKGGPCRVFGSGLKVRTSIDGYRSPDVTIDCGQPAPQALFADKPTVLFEVLSPSTEWFDETDKLAEYQALACVQHIVLLSQRRPFGRLWAREGERWRTTEIDAAAASIDLPALGVSLPMAEIYEGVAFAPEED